MKSFVLSLAVAGLVTAQSISDIPECPLQCITAVLPDVGCDGPEDFACACSNIEEVTGQALECLTSNCSSEDIVAAQAAAAEACAAIETSTSTQTFGSVDPDPSATTTVIGTIIPDPTETETVTETETEDPSVTLSPSDDLTTPGVSTTPSTTPRPTPTSSSDDEEETGTETETEEPGATETNEDDGGSGVAKPLAGIGAALLAVLAAL